MPYISYLIFGTVYNHNSILSPDVSIEVITSVGRRYYTSNSNGIFMLDLAEIGYLSGEIVTVNITDEFNNEYKNHTFVVEGSYHEENITLTLRTDAVNATDYSPKTILHSVGKKPITDDNPLPIFDKSDMLKEYVLSGGDDTNRIYGYINKKGAWYIQKYDSSNFTYKYVKGASDFSTNWTNRASLTYDFFNEVFG